jgi:hypothetical protein
VIQPNRFASRRRTARPTTHRPLATGGAKGPSRDELAIRWFTPRGRMALSDLQDELRHGDGSALGDLVGELRRDGAAEGAVDLRGIDLSGIDLAHAHLGRVDLRGARLDRTNLSRADLREANLERASLREAVLRGTNFGLANLSRTDLREADLSEANLEGASIEGAKMRDAVLTRTWARGVDFGTAHAQGVNLSQVQRKEHRPPRTRTARRQGLGAPPRSEPMPKQTRRFRVQPSPTRRLTPATPFEIPLVSEVQDLDKALARLLLERDGVTRIVAEIDGQEVVLFARLSDIRPARRVA